MSESAATVRLPDGREWFIVGEAQVVKRTSRMLSRWGFDRFRRLR